MLLKCMLINTFGALCRNTACPDRATGAPETHLRMYTCKEFPQHPHALWRRHVIVPWFILLCRYSTSVNSWRLELCANWSLAMVSGSSGHMNVGTVLLLPFHSPTKFSRPNISKYHSSPDISGLVSVQPVESPSAHTEPDTTCHRAFE